MNSPRVDSVAATSDLETVNLDSVKAELERSPETKKLLTATILEFQNGAYADYMSALEMIGQAVDLV